jgi:uroporphyrinogen-III synthase
MPSSSIDDSHVDVLHQTVSRIARADGFHQALDRVLDFAAEVVKCDSCFIYVLEEQDLVLRASKNPHQELLDRLKLRLGQGITGWVAEHREPVAISKEAFKDSRFQRFNELPEDRYEAFLSVPLLSRGRLVGVMNLQHRDSHVHSTRDIRLLSTIGFMAGAEIEVARLETKNSDLSQQLETRKLVERARRNFATRSGINGRAGVSRYSEAEPPKTQDNERSRGSHRAERGSEEQLARGVELYLPEVKDVASIPN